MLLTQVYSVINRIDHWQTPDWAWTVCDWAFWLGPSGFVRPDWAAPFGPPGFGPATPIGHIRGMSLRYLRDMTLGVLAG